MIFNINFNSQNLLYFSQSLVYFMVKSCPFFVIVSQQFGWRQNFFIFFWELA